MPRLFYAETVPVIYRSRTFDFGIDVFGIVPFLRKMTPLARQSVQSIRMEILNPETYELKKHGYQYESLRARANTKDLARTSRIS